MNSIYNWKTCYSFPDIEEIKLGYFRLGLAN